MDTTAYLTIMSFAERLKNIIGNRSDQEEAVSEYPGVLILECSTIPLLVVRLSNLKSSKNFCILRRLNN
jgi:hypothetical protein